MVLLKNIKKTDDYIEADYYPEATDAAGHIRIGNDKNVISVSYSEEDNSVLRSYFVHARKRLRELLDVESNSVPKETVVMWY